MSWLSAASLLLSLAMSCKTARSLRERERKRRAMRGPYSQPYRYYQSTRQAVRKR